MTMRLVRPAHLGVLALLILTTGLIGLLVVPAQAQTFGPEPTPDKSVTRPHPKGGFVAPSFDTEHVSANVEANLGLNRGLDKALPAAYDCRTTGQVTSVKNQGNCGACYTFTAAADLESKILIDGGGTYDFSENHMKECNFDGTSCGGGNQYQIMNLLSRDGAVLESCDPYVAGASTCDVACYREFVVLDWSAISGNTVPTTNVLKQYMVDHGPLQTTLYAGNADAWYTAFGTYNGTGALTYGGTETPNHSVMLVGWDDNVGGGSWIIKNSWHTSWGGTCGFGAEGGYGYVTYGSASIGKWSSFVGEYTGNNDDMDVRYLDEAGHTSGWGGVGTTLWGLAGHDIPADAYLHRVEFWTADATSDVDVYVYDTFSGGTLSSLLYSSLNNSYDEPGYHHVELGAPLALSAGQDVWVAVQFTNQTSLYPVTIDSDGATNTGKSWYSLNGTGWTSLGPSGADVTIRLRTSTSTVLSNGEVDPDPQPGGHELPRTLKLHAAWPNPFNPTTNISYDLPRSGPATVAIYDLHGHLVRTLWSGNQVRGTQTLPWDGLGDDGRRVASGTYFCKVTAGDEVQTQKLALLK